jgi:hypothetical protein
VTEVEGASFVRLALNIVMEMGAILWMYFVDIFCGCIPPIPKHAIQYVSIQFCIIKDLVHISIVVTLLLTEGTVRTWWSREDNIKVLLRKNEFRVDSTCL